MASEKSSVKPAAERAIAGGAVGRGAQPKNAQQAGSKSARGPLGPRIPEHMRKALEGLIARRIERDVVAQKTLRAEAVGLLETFIKEESPRRARCPRRMMRLGELYWETEREQFVIRFHEWEKKPVDQRGPTPDPNFDRARALFARVLKDYKNFESYDLALYVDGFLATEQGKSDEALDRFNRILEGYPKSRFIPDAHMARAEAAFNGKYDYAGALVEYEKVMQYPQSDLYGLALFKSAWCQWRLGRTDEAAKRFLQVFQVTDEGQQVSASKRKQLDELQAEALKYLVEVFTEDEKNSADDVYNFLVKAGGDKFAGKIVKALAAAFYEQAHYERGIEAYELMLKLDPVGPEAPDYGLAIAQGYATIEDWPKLKATYDRLLKTFTLPEQGTEGGAWARAQTNPEVVKAAQAKIEKQLREDATNLHGKAQRDKSSRAEFEGAAALYEVYLSKFGKSDGVVRSRVQPRRDLFLSPGQEQRGRHPLHGDRAAQPQGSAHPRRALQRHLGSRAARATPSSKRRPRARPTSTRSSPRRWSSTSSSIPNDPDIPELLFRQGKLYYDHQVYDAAVRQWGLLLEKYPELQVCGRRGRARARLFQSVEGLLEHRGVGAPAEDRALVSGRPSSRRGSTRSSCSRCSSRASRRPPPGSTPTPQPRTCAPPRSFPSDPRAGQACVNAEIESQKAGDIATMKTAADLLITDHRDAPEAALGAWTAATQFQGMGLFADAATYHEVLAERFPKSEHAKDAAYNAVLLRTTIGDYEKAIADGKRYRQQYRDRPRGRRSGVLDGQGPRAREEVARGGRSLPQLRQEREEPRSQSRGVRASRHGGHQA